MCQLIFEKKCKIFWTSAWRCFTKPTSAYKRLFVCASNQAHYPVIPKLCHPIKILSRHGVSWQNASFVSWRRLGHKNTDFRIRLKPLVKHNQNRSVQRTTFPEQNMTEFTICHRVGCIIFPGLVILPLVGIPFR